MRIKAVVNPGILEKAPVFSSEDSPQWESVFVSTLGLIGLGQVLDCADDLAETDVV